MSNITTAQSLELERNELGYSLEEVRKGRKLRVIHYEVPESDVCVFFIHGGGGRAGQFKHLIRNLKNIVNVVAFDFLGHGESPHIPQSNLYTADEHLEDLMAVFKKYRRNKNVYVSHCYGSIHVLRHLKLMKERRELDCVGGVMMVALGVTAPASLGIVTRTLPAFVLELLRPMARSSSNAAIFAPQSDPSIISFENSISNTNRMYAMRTIGSDCSSQSAWKAWLEGGRQALAAANIPCCLVTGEYDGIFSSESSLRFKEMLGVSDDMYHEIEGVGHLPMVEKGDEVAAILRDFLCNNSGELECVERSSRRSSRSSSEGSERRGGRSSTASNRSSAASSN